MTALMAAPTAAALADVHSEPATNRARLGQFVLILQLRPFVLDLPATLAPRSERRVELLTDLPKRLPVSMPAVSDSPSFSADNSEHRTNSAASSSTGSTSSTSTWDALTATTTTQLRR